MAGVASESASIPDRLVWDEAVSVVVPSEQTDAVRSSSFNDGGVNSGKVDWIRP